MTHTTFVIRLLDADRRVLAWTKTPAVPKGDGCLWAMQYFVAEAEVAGTATHLCYHWVDVNVHTTVPLPQPIGVTVGQVITVPLREPLVTIGSDHRPLPPLTVRQPVTVGVASATR
jgi:hypothetical protein